MSKIAQSFSFNVSQPTTLWRQDIVLETPKLRFPLDEVRFCPKIYLLNGHSAGITLYWNTVPGTVFYVLQLCDNQSFTGPNIKGIKTTNTEFELNYLEHLRVGEQFFWRVSAHNITGGTSVMSEVRSVKIACPETQGVSFNNEYSAYADIDSPRMCDNTGVDIELSGPEWVRKTDSERTWVLNVNYDCDSFEGHEVRIHDVVWEIRQSPQAPVTVNYDSNDYIKLDISAYEEEWFELIAHVIMELVGVGYFECKANKKILIEGVPVGGGGAPIITFQILTVNCVNGAATGVVTRRTCGSGVHIGAIVDLIDDTGCHLGNNPIILIGRKGKATPMDDDEPKHSDGNMHTSGCRWTIITICPAVFQC